MAVSHTNALELLGKHIHFTVSLSKEMKHFFPNGLSLQGKVIAVLIQLDGFHQILVDGDFYALSKIDIHLTA